MVNLSKQDKGDQSHVDTSLELVKQLQVETQVLVEAINAQFVRGMMPTQEQLNALQALVTVILQYANFNVIAQNFVPYLQQQIDNIVKQIKTLQENQQAQEQDAVIAKAIQSLMSGYNSQFASQNSESFHPGLASENKMVPGHSRSESDMNRNCQLQDEIITDFNVLRRVDHDFIVCKLYDDLQLVSESDGARFATREDLRQHLDWLFEWNKRLRARKQGGICRMWYPSVQEWIQGSASAKNSGAISSSMIFDDGFTETRIDRQEQRLINEDEDVHQSFRNGNKVFAGDCEDSCFVCGDCFEMEWDDELEALVYKDAVKEGDDDETKIFHVDCYSVWKAQGGIRDWKNEERDTNDVDQVKELSEENSQHESHISTNSPDFNLKAEPKEFDTSEDFQDADISGYPQKRLRTV